MDPSIILTYSSNLLQSMKVTADQGQTYAYAQKIEDYYYYYTRGC
jgi:hypothetical protein